MRWTERSDVYKAISAGLQSCQSAGYQPASRSLSLVADASGANLRKKTPLKERPAYTRKISSEEAREGYVLVVKSRLSFFPPLGNTFQLIHDHKRSRARVESYRCTCRGPALPHEHYFIRWKGLKDGDRIEIREDAKKLGRYIIRVRG